MYVYFEEYLAEAERRLFNSEQRPGQVLQAPQEYDRVGRERNKERAGHYGREGTLLRDKVRIRD